MEADPDPQQAVTDAVATVQQQNPQQPQISAARRAQLLAMFAVPPGPVAITRANVANALNGGHAANRVGNSRIAIGRSGSGLTVNKLDGTQIGFLRYTLDGTTGRVQQITVNDDCQGQRLGKLLAVAFYEEMANQGATHVELGTNDTSGGFWAVQGLAEHRLTPIATPRAHPGNQNFAVGQ
jgi:ribosomal protein S18 acetylase RimI-like enzyme